MAFCLLQAFCIVCYFMVGFYAGAAQFFLFLAVFCMFQLTSESIGVLCATATSNATFAVLVSRTPGQSTANCSTCCHLGCGEICTMHAQATLGPLFPLAPTVSASSHWHPIWRFAPLLLLGDGLSSDICHLRPEIL